MQKRKGDQTGAPRRLVLVGNLDFGVPQDQRPAETKRRAFIRMESVGRCTAHVVELICHFNLVISRESIVLRDQVARQALVGLQVIGSLYQYFPNKEALPASVLERHLLKVIKAIEEACEAVEGQSAKAMAAAVVDAFLGAKFSEPDVSRALYALAAQTGGMATLARVTQRAQIALCDMLATASDGQVFKSGARLSMDGRGAWGDNVFVERLWRTVK
jgi:Tetracyclin repressor-like, C-terminal domain